MLGRTPFRAADVDADHNLGLVVSLPQRICDHRNRLPGRVDERDRVSHEDHLGRG